MPPDFDSNERDSARDIDILVIVIAVLLFIVSESDVAIVAIAN